MFELFSKIELWLADIALLSVEPQRRITEHLFIRHLIQQRGVSFFFLYKMALAELRLSASSRNSLLIGKSFARMAVSIATNAIPFVGARKRREALRSRSQDVRVNLLVKSLALDTDDEKVLIEELQASPDEMALIRKLAEWQKEKIKKTLDPKKKTVATFSSFGAYREQYGNIVQRLREKGYNAITFLGQAGSPEFGKKEGVFYGGLEIIGFMDFVDVFLCTGDAYPLLPTGAKVGLFLHDIHDSPPGNVEDILNGILFYDFQFIPSACVLERVKQQVYAAQKKLFRKIGKVEKTCLIPGGYIKLDSNIQYFEKHRKDSRTIVYAPTVYGPGFEDIVSLDTYGSQIIGAILDNFPEYELVFRPHPRTADSSYVREALKKYCGNPRFSFDNNATFYMDNYSKAALMISDMSGTAYTFALTTLKPVIFFSHNEKKVMKQMGDYRFFTDRDKIGYLVSNIEEMITKIGYVLNNPELLSEKVKQYRDATIYNVGFAEDYFINNFEYIINDKIHPDWSYL